jgi:hypothetical protein
MITVLQSPVRTEGYDITRSNLRITPIPPVRANRRFRALRVQGQYRGWKYTSREEGKRRCVLHICKASYWNYLGGGEIVSFYSCFQKANQGTWKYFRTSGRTFQFLRIVFPYLKINFVTFADLDDLIEVEVEEIAWNSSNCWVTRHSTAFNYPT